MRSDSRIPAAMYAQVATVRPGKRNARRVLRLSEDQARQIGLVVDKKKRPSALLKPLDPQTILTAALIRRLGKDAVQSEVVGLVPGRRYRADIVIPAARLVIEFDGFEYHRSKSAFQEDRERQNAFVQHGWRVLRFFNKQVLNDLAGVVDLILSCLHPSNPSF